jgi:hypothetical protein
LVLRIVRLSMIVGFGDDDAIHQDARNLHLPRIEGSPVGDALDLRNHKAAGIVDSHRERERFDRERLTLHCDVAIGVRGGSANDAEVERQGFIEQVFLAAHRDQFDEVFRRLFVHLPAAEPRVNEGSQTDARQMARLPRRNVAIEVHDRSEGQIVAFDLIVDDESLDRWREIEMAADHPFYEARLGDPIKSAPGERMGLSDPKKQGQVPGLPQRPRLGVLRLIKVREFVNDRLGEADPAESADRDRVPASDQTDRLARRDDFARVAGSCGRNDLGNRHDPLPLDCRIGDRFPEINAVLSAARSHA